ncbi:superfamily II DNA/RNA helicase [Brevundimonas sp. UYEF29]|uniref:DEAD/DEAH box helicase n=1 Tax=Brevundimonas sp. UYEF29 TaxID=3156346 RepID=UPI0033943376
MFDPVTVDLIGHAPPLASLDLAELPKRFTNAYAEIVAARVRMRGLVDANSRTEALSELIDEMRRLAAAQEAFVAADPARDTRAAAAFVAGAAHQLCLMAEIVKTDGGADDDDDVADDGEDANAEDADGLSDELPRLTYVDAVRAAPEVCATLLFLIANAQPDAAEMAKRIHPPEGMTGEAQLIRAIADLAAGRLGAINPQEPPPYARSADRSPAGLATDALLRRLHAGIRMLAAEIFARPSDTAAPSRAREIFLEVKGLAFARLDDVFDEGGPIAVSVFPGPLHLANLLIVVAGDLAESALCHVPAPSGVDANAWWKTLRRAARKRPYLWRNHREAINKGYLMPGVSAAVSFPTGGGKSTLAELKIAAALLSDKKVVVLAPTLALVDQTAFTLGNAFKDYEVLGDLDEEISFSDIVELPEIIVTTPERCLMLQALQADAFADVGLIVFDECHLIHPRDADRSRRGVDAMLCVLNLTHTAPDADLLMISAMMQNAQEMAGWLQELTGRTALALDLAWKPTRQARGCVTYEASRIKALEQLLTRAKRTATTKTTPKAVKDQLSAKPFAFFCLKQTWATVDRNDYALMPLLDKSVAFNTGTSRSGDWYLTPNGNRVAAEIAAAAAGDGLKTLVFVQSTVAAEGSVKTFRALLPDRRIELTEAEAAMRRRIEEEMGGAQYCYLMLDDAGHVVGGATSHHAQLLKDERDLHKSLFERRDGLDALFATSTVAQGMNLPSDIVLIAGDSRWDDSQDKMQQLAAHELLNAAGRAGRAGESGQGFVLIVPSRVIDLDDDANQIDQHWMSLQGIFAQSDQCLTIDDPLTALLDRIHNGLEVGDNEDYLLARLPAGAGGDADEPAREMLRRSFAAYRKRQEGKVKWIESRIDASLARRAELAPQEETSGLAQVASSVGLPVEIVVSLAKRIDKGKFTGDTVSCVAALFQWLEKNPSFVLQLMRPSDVEGLFGKDYRALANTVEQARFALPVLRALTEKWMAAEPLCKLELAAGTPAASLRSCEIARHFANRVVPDIAFVAGLPARILAARAVEDDDVVISTTIATLAGAVRRGCDSPEVLASAVHQGREVSRVGARSAFDSVRKYLPAGNNDEDFDATLDRVRQAHTVALFDED